MSKTIVFDKPSMPYSAGEVATFDDEQAERYLRHPRGVAHQATTREIDDAHNRYSKRRSAAAPAPLPAQVSTNASAKEDESSPKTARSGR